MVCGRMGLLDEAIRDHLELKRRAGADPAEIAHAERAALAPVFPDEPRAAGANDDVTEQVPRRTPAPDDGGAVAAAAPVAAAPADGEAEGFEWEDPTAIAHDADAEGPPEQIPGQERMSLE